ncbi:MAG: (2Fe-2S)-binding protein [Brevinemataceae bacterium]
MSEKSKIICTCLGITKAELEKAISEIPNCTLDQLIDATGAGSICGMCIDGSNGEDECLQSILQSSVNT